MDWGAVEQDRDVGRKWRVEFEEGVADLEGIGEGEEEAERWRVGGSVAIETITELAWQPDGECECEQRFQRGERVG